MIIYFLVVLAITTRFLPHPANFTAVGAVALFAGYYIKDKRLALILPLLIMLASDWLIDFYHWPIMLSVYGSFLLTTVLGIIITKRHWLWSLPTSLVGGLLFFLITNWAVWQFGNWYPHTTNGLWLCYLAGLPFLKYTLAGNLVYTTILFGIKELAAFCLDKKTVRVLKYN